MKSKFNPIIRAGWVLLLVCAIALIAIFFLIRYSESDHWLESFWWLIIAVPVFVFDAVFLLALYSARDRYEKGRAAQQTGDYLVQWMYTQVHWERFLKDDWQKTRKRTLVASFIMIVIFMIIMLAAGAMKSERMFWYVLSGAIGFLAIVAYFILHFSHAVYRTRLAGPREVIIGRTGVTVSGIYTAWDTIGASLLDVRIIRGSLTILEFVIGTRGRVGSSSSLYVPVPEGREHEAEELLSKLR